VNKLNFPTKLTNAIFNYQSLKLAYMRRSRYGLFAMGTLMCISAVAQQSTTVTGSVKNSKTKEAVSAVSISIKGGTAGTFTDDKGNFRFSTVQKTPFTIVISSVGYTTKEVAVTGNNQVINAELDVSFTLGEEVVVAASRVPERILESPVSIERISNAAIRNAPAVNYYDMLTNLKGVDAVAASLTFRSIGTRGFNVSGNARLNQIMDGMDNQAPGLNFAVGSIIGLTELDVDNVELLPGASSALYGSGGMNGTVLINSKNPFKYQGLSFQIKMGLKDIDGYQRPTSKFYDWSVRFADKISDKFSYKIGAQYIQAQDWMANQDDNFSRAGNVVKPGTRVTDPNYDGVNVYGDETTQNMTNVFGSVFAATGLPAPVLAGSNAFLAAFPAATLAEYSANFLVPNLGAPTTAALTAQGINVLLYGQGRNFFNNQFVSRTGYAEKDVISPETYNFKLTGGLYYKLTEKIEASFTANWGTGNSVYTGSDRYSLKELMMGQYKLELRSKNWFLKAYTTHENAGGSFNATITTRLFNEAWKPSATWYVQYMATYAGSRAAGADELLSHSNARAAADQGRPTGFIGNTPLFKAVASKPISQGGGLFLDQSRLNVFEGQYNLSDDLKLTEKGTDVLIGASSKQYVLNSQGTLFADTAGNIKINEVGAYIQISQKFLDDKLKLTVSGRYDKNSGFQGRFTPRASAVVKLAKDHNLRFSYQQAYRFPTTQNQWINLTVGGGTKLIGGLPQLKTFYNFSGNPTYTPESVGQYRATGNATLLQQQQYGDFKPESSQSFEVGYKGLIANKLLIDVYAYWATYKDFLSTVNAYQARVASSGPGALLSDASSFIYTVSVNTPGNVKTSGWGASVEYLLPKNFSVSGNLYHDQIGALPGGFISYFNTPKYRTNIALNNSGFGKDNRFGFTVQYRWANSFYYEGTFASGMLPWVRTVDAAVTYKLPSTKSIIKVGGTNILNKYYRTAFGSPQFGALYYISFGYNVF
jgi:outer membrane receptor protein involved in Fe transport